MVMRSGSVKKCMSVITVCYICSTVYVCFLYTRTLKPEKTNYTSIISTTNGYSNSSRRRVHKTAVPISSKRDAVHRVHTTVVPTSPKRDAVHAERIIHYNLTEILMVRIYDTDKAKWTLNELKQWLHYMLFAGVEHVYLCDHFIHRHERLDGPLHKYITEGIITYIPWPWNATNAKLHGDIMRHQTSCYGHVHERYGNQSSWQLTVDMDEYPFCPDDVTHGFLARFLAQEACDRCQMLMENYIMMGQGDRTRNMTIARINRIVKKPPNRLTKPIYKPAHVRKYGFQIHTNSLLRGYKTVTLDPDKVRMLHYWGARTQNWGPDTDETIRKTEEFNVVRDTIANHIRLSLLNYGEFDAFSNATGP